MCRWTNNLFYPELIAKDGTPVINKFVNRKVLNVRALQAAATQIGG